MPERQRATISFAITFGGNLVAAGCGLAAVILVSQSLNVSSFGVFAMLLSLVQTIPMYIGFGLDSGMMRFVSKRLNRGEDNLAGATCALILKFRAATALLALAAVALWLASPLAPGGLRGLPAWLCIAVGTGVAATSVMNCLRSGLWAYGRYALGAAAQFAVDCAKLCAVGSLVLVGVVSCGSTAAAFACAPVFGLVPAAVWLGKTLPSGVSPIPAAKALAGLLRFCVWSYISESANVSLSVFGLFIVDRHLGSGQAGIYGLAHNLTYFIPILLMSLRAVLLPRAARIESRNEYDRYCRAAARWGVWVAIAAVPVLLAAPPVIAAVFDSGFSASGKVFNLLFAAQMAAVARSPYNALISAVNRPRFLAATDTGRLILMVAGSWLFVPTAGVATPAMILLVLNLLSYLLCSAYVRRIPGRSDNTLGSEQIAKVAEL